MILVTGGTGLLGSHLLFDVKKQVGTQQSCSAGYKYHEWYLSHKGT